MRIKHTSVGLFMVPDPAVSFIKPDHIDPHSLAALPDTPGVYLFRDAAGVPLYIGKSVHVRRRVQSHLRNANEAAMLDASVRVDAVETAGEIGALLLESSLIKQWQPPWNALLLHANEPWVLASDVQSLGLAVVRASAAQEGGMSAHGVFASRREAESMLLRLIRESRLCPGLSGLEQVTPGRGCFSRQLARCDGACAGKVSMADYAARRQHALNQLDAAVWPYKGAIGIIEQRPGLRQMHVIDRWSYRGTVQGRKKTPPRGKRGDVDTDVYRIIAGPLRAGRLTVAEL